MRKPEPHLLVIFGASGDLTARKLIPAVFNLFEGDFLPDNFAILGVSRTQYSDESFRQKVTEANGHLKKDGIDDKILRDFTSRLFYLPINTSAAEDYQLLKQRMEDLDRQCGTAGNAIFYLSTPPSLYQFISKSLTTVGLNRSPNGWRRLVIEKPFGYDLKTAIDLNKQLHKNWKEDQLYRIDHYLGKETVQNLFVTRFANSIFEPLWNRNYVHHVEITSAEKVGVEKRGGYYDKSGALRDMVQNHLLQLVALVAMEPPVKSDAHAVRSEKLKLFQSLRPLDEEHILTDVIRGQYVKSTINGKPVAGYRDEEGVDPESRTETYLAMKFFIDNWRWAGVPFYIRTGKRLPTRVTEVVIHFKPIHHHLFINYKHVANSDNLLVLRIQPNEGMLLKVGVKVPGAGFNVTPVNLDFHLEELAEAHVPEAYERLLLDCMAGDATLYSHGNSVESAWSFINPILEVWENNPDVKMFGYPAGTWGPEHADSLIETENMTWRYPCSNLADDGTYCEL